MNNLSIQSGADVVFFNEDAPDPKHLRVIEPGPGHLDLGNGGYSVDVHLDLDASPADSDSATVAELHLGFAKHDPEMGEDIADVAAACIELSLDDIDNLIKALRNLRKAIA